MERTLAIIKPDAVAARHTGAIISRIEEAGFGIRALRLRAPHAARGRGFLRRASRAAVLSAADRVHVVRPGRRHGARGAGRHQEVAHADGRDRIPAKADAGTLRKEFGASIERNATHGSDAPETAAFEIGYFFAGVDLLRACRSPMDAWARLLVRDRLGDRRARPADDGRRAARPAAGRHRRAPRHLHVLFPLATSILLSMLLTLLLSFWRR